MQYATLTTALPPLSMADLFQEVKTAICEHPKVQELNDGYKVVLPTPYRLLVTSEYFDGKQEIDVLELAATTITGELELWAKLYSDTCPIATTGTDIELAPDDDPSDPDYAHDWFPIYTAAGTQWCIIDMLNIRQLLSDAPLFIPPSTYILVEPDNIGKYLETLEGAPNPNIITVGTLPEGWPELPTIYDTIDRNVPVPLITVKELVGLALNQTRVKANSLQGFINYIDYGMRGNLTPESVELLTKWLADYQFHTNPTACAR